MYSIKKYASANMITSLRKHKCQSCGECCRWEGQVFLYPTDVAGLAWLLKKNNADVIKNYCSLITWNTRNNPQYRLGLLRKSLGECIFLQDNLCLVNSKKPLICKAGPAGWHWITHQEKFHFYVKRAPCFKGKKDRLSIVEANDLFLESWEKEFEVSNISTIEDLANFYYVETCVINSINRISL